MRERDRRYQLTRREVGERASEEQRFCPPTNSAPTLLKKAFFTMADDSAATPGSPTSDFVSRFLAKMAKVRVCRGGSQGLHSTLRARSG
jgi:hypothetical protein